MLRRVRQGPAARQEEGEDHRSGACVPQPEAAPDPERKDSPDCENQRLGPVRRRRIMAAEKSGLHPNAEKTNRADGKRFLDPISIQKKLGNGDFGGGVAKGSADQQENTNSLL